MKPNATRYLFTLLSALLLLFPLTLASQDGWINQMQEINSGLYDIHSPEGVTTWDGDLYWVVGDSGLVMKSSGGPTALSRMETNTTANLRGVYFFLDGTGFCVGEMGTCIKASNFGNTWSTVSLNTTENLNDIWFVDETTGYILGDGGLFLVTTDRGLTWNAGNLVAEHDLNKFRQLTGSVFWIVGDAGTVYKTTDAGNTWLNISTGFESNCNDIYVADINCAYIACDNGLVIKTEDHGSTWQDFSIPDTADLHGITGVNCYNLYVCGDQGAVYLWTGDTPTWRTYQGPTEGLDFKTVFYDEEEGYFYFLADSGYYTYATFNGYGYPQKAGENLYLETADFVDAAHGFVGGICATLYHTNDGGEHWYSLHMGDFSGNSGSPSVRDIEFTDTLRGWVILDRYYNYSDHTYIFKTEDGGITWTKQYQSNSKSLHKIFFIDSLHGWTAGKKDFVMKTDDGGENWLVIQEENPEVEYLTGLHFNNLLDGYRVRDYSEFLVTHDGGYSWQSSGTFSGMMEEMFVMQDSMIWLLMGFSGLNISKDGGATWNNFPFPYNSSNAHSLFFLDELEGWACGGGPSLWRTHDGGETWEQLYDGQYLESFNNVIFTDSLNGWLIGQYGSIMHGPGLYTEIPEKRDIKTNNLSIYPNPARNIITITNPEFDPGMSYSVSIYNVTGRMVISQQINDQSETFTIDISSCPPGIYIAVLYQEGRMLETGKFIVVKD